MDSSTRRWAWLGTVIVLATLIVMAFLIDMPAQAWVTLVVGVVATGGVLLSWRQKFDSDRRAEWWRRISWSFDHVLSGDAEREAFGWVVLDHLAKSTLATKDDADLFQTVAERWIDRDTEDEPTEGGAT